jgi:hypothetical protein
MELRKQYTTTIDPLLKLYEDFAGANSLQICDLHVTETWFRKTLQPTNATQVTKSRHIDAHHDRHLLGCRTC